MKLLRIILGFYLLYLFGKEYISASYQIGTFVNPGIIIALLVALLSTWLIGSGLSGSQFNFKSIKFVVYLAISLLFLGAVVYISALSYVVPGTYVNINGVNVPLKDCINGNRRLIPDERSREEYCKCVVENITNQPELTEKYKADLENGRVDQVLTALQADSTFDKTGVQNCLMASEIVWTDALAESMKANLKKELIGTEFEETNDIDKYCDCLMNEFRKYPLRDVMSAEFSESILGKSIAESCNAASRTNVKMSLRTD
jgi:hypothetical protein